MQKLILAVLALAPLSALPVQAQTAGATQGAVAATDVDVRIDAALANARRRVLAGDLDRAAYNELVAAIRAGYTALTTATPATDTVRTRLVSAVDDIYTRAKTTRIDDAEWRLFLIEVLDARLDNYIAIAVGDPQIDSVKRITNYVNGLVEAAKLDDASIETLRQRVQALIDELTKKARVLPADLEPVKLEVSVARVLRGETLLETRVLARTATKTDWTRARDHIWDHFTIISKAEPTARDIQQRLLAILDGLEARAAKGALTREDFNELRTMLTERARVIAAGAPK